MVARGASKNAKETGGSDHGLRTTDYGPQLFPLMFYGASRYVLRFIHQRVELMGGRSEDLIQGTLDMLILKTLTLGRLHGYGIVQRIQQVSNDVLQVEEGSLYPALHRMEQKGWIASEWGTSENNRRARYYVLTKVGRKQLKTELSLWAKLSDATGRVLDFVPDKG